MTKKHLLVKGRNYLVDVHVKSRTYGKQGGQRRISNLVEGQGPTLDALICLPTDARAGNRLLLGKSRKRPRLSPNLRANAAQLDVESFEVMK